MDRPSFHLTWAHLHGGALTRGHRFTPIGVALVVGFLLAVSLAIALA